MKGGYQILDLSSITLVKDTETTITDLNILNQLLGLTDFLNKNGLLDKQLKPIYIITKDSAGYVSITNNDTNKLLIDGYISGLNIQLNITYTSSLDDYGNTVYAISSAKYIYAAVSGGTKLYLHWIRSTVLSGYESIIVKGCIIDTNSSPYTKDTIPNLSASIFNEYGTHKANPSDSGTTYLLKAVLGGDGKAFTLLSGVQLLKLSDLTTTYIARADLNSIVDSVTEL